MIWNAPPTCQVHRVSGRTPWGRLRALNLDAGHCAIHSAVGCGAVTLIQTRFRRSSRMMTRIEQVEANGRGNEQVHGDGGWARGRQIACEVPGLVYAPSLPWRPRPLPPLAGRRPKGSTGAILDRRQTRCGSSKSPPKSPKGLNSGQVVVAERGPDNAFR
jgi:hypothetical protein